MLVNLSLKFHLKILPFVFSTKQKVQQRKAEAEQALDQKLADETQQATKNDELERGQRKV